MLRDSSNPFPISPGPPAGKPGHAYNLSDTVAVSTGGIPFQSIRSQGAALAIVPALTPGVDNHWVIRSLAITANLAFLLAETNTNAPMPMYGRFGKIIAGVIPGKTNPSPQAQFSPAAQYWTPPPVDSTLITDFWNPANDDMPPISNGSTNTGFAGTLPIMASLSLPQDRNVDPGEPTAIGIWMLPSLLGSPVATLGFGSAGLTIYDAQFVIVYDDGN